MGEGGSGDLQYVELFCRSVQTGTNEIAAFLCYHSQAWLQ